MLKSIHLAILLTLCFLEASSQSFIHETKLTASTKEELSYFGSSVDIYGKTIMMGAWGQSRDGSYQSDEGAVYFFSLDESGLWKNTQIIFPSDSSIYHQFGETISLLANYAVVGAPGGKHWSNGIPAWYHRGAVYFLRKSTDGVWGHQQKVTPPTSDSTFIHRFGRAVSCNGKYTAVGARTLEEDSLFEAGTVYIYMNLEGETWSLSQQLNASDRDSLDDFGANLILLDSTLLISAPMDDNGAGAVYIFTLDIDGNWSEQEKLIPATRLENDNFGIGIAYSENQLGVRSNNFTFLFTRDDNNSWIEKIQLNTSDLLPGSSSISVHKDILALGSYGWSYSISDSNFVNIYKITNSGSLEFSQQICPDDQYNIRTTQWGEFVPDLFGADIKLTDSILVIGAPLSRVKVGPGGGEYEPMPIGGAYIYYSSDFMTKIITVSCDEYDFNGQKIVESGIYRDTLQNSAGNDSLVVLEITIHKSPDPTILNCGNFLVANDKTAQEYQWLDCTDFYNPIVGETKPIFRPRDTGIYALSISRNNCNSISECIDFNIDENPIDIIVNPKITRTDSLSRSGDELQISDLQINDNTMFVGALFTNRGYQAEDYFVDVYVKDESDHWFHNQRLPQDTEAYHGFGRAISIYENYAFIAADTPGAVFVYQKNDDFWEEVQILSISCDDCRFFDRSISIHKDYAIIGAQYTDERDYELGIAFIYKRDVSGKWNLIKELRAPGTEWFYDFGWEVQMLPNLAIISAPGEGSNPYKNLLDPPFGAVYIYKEVSSGTWNEIQKIIQPKPSEFFYKFGKFFAADEERMIISGFSIGGGYYRHSNLSYTRTCDDFWILEQDIEQIQDGHGDWNSSQVSLSNNYLAIARQDTIHLFTINEIGNWTKIEDFKGKSATLYENDLAIVKNDNYLIEMYKLEGGRVTSVGLISDHDSVSIWPNPTSNTINIDLGKTYDNVQIQILSTSGELIDENIFKNVQIIELDIILNPGIYILHIITDVGIIASQMILVDKN